MPGYLKPFHFVSFFEFVRQGKYATQSFQEFLQAKVSRLETQGVLPKN